MPLYSRVLALLMPLGLWLYISILDSLLSTDVTGHLPVFADLAYRVLEKVFANTYAAAFDGFS